MAMSATFGTMFAGVVFIDEHQFVPTFGQHFPDPETGNGGFPLHVEAAGRPISGRDDDFLAAPKLCSKCFYHAVLMIFFLDGRSIAELRPARFAVRSQKFLAHDHFFLHEFQVMAQHQRFGIQCL
jgi:hypothetical protein